MTRAIVGMSLPKEQSVSTTAVVILKGGAGSGHHGHKGIPGHQGGSLPKGTASSVIPDNKADAAEKFRSTHDYLWQEMSLEESMQRQFEVLGYDPLEIIRRGRNRVKMLEDRDFDKQAIYEMSRNPENVYSLSGFIGWNGTVTVRCGRWSEYRKNRLLDLDEIDDDPWSPQIDTITHEFGHIVYSNTDRETIAHWTKAYDDGGLGRPTEYSKKHEREGFAESYTAYVNTRGVAVDPYLQATFAEVEKVLDASRRKYSR